MKISLFLGAGASAAYGMPTTKGFKDHMMKKCGGRPEWLGMLAGGEDIEEVLTAAMEITSIPDTRGGRYLENRHPQIKETFKSMKRLEDLIKHEVHEAYSWDARYNAALDSVLGPWLDLIRKHGQDVVVFTTNYDRSVEEHCSNRGQLFKDGFEPDSAGDYMRWTGMLEGGGQYAWNMGQSTPPLRLLKLHGSLGWKHHASRGPVRVNYEKKSSDPNQQDLLIYPSLSPKAEEAAEPYATIFKHFHEQLMSSDACIVVGFSFRDERVCDEFVEFVGQGKKLVVVSPTGEADLVEHVPRSKAHQDPQGRLAQTQAVKTVLVSPPSDEGGGGGGGGSAIVGMGGAGRSGGTRGGAVRPGVANLAEIFPDMPYGRSNNTIYVIQSPVSEDSISKIVGLTQNILFGGGGGSGGYAYHGMPFE